MKDGKCPKCSSARVCYKEYALNNITIDGRGVDYVDYVCTDCGYFETYITDKNALSKIAAMADKSGDWKMAK
jgi:predicted nucleic-acid-binding Zn-ribbon protein